MKSGAKFFKKILSPKVSLAGADKWLLMASGLLLIFGLIILASASSVVAFDKTGDSYYFVKRQLVAVIVGLGAFWLAFNVDYRKLKESGWILFVLNIILLIVVLIVGVARNGSRAWIPLMGFNLQPSEILKLTFLLYLAAKLTKQGLNHEDKIVPFGIAFSVVAVLVVAQPDVGTLFIISASALASFFVAKAPMKHILSILGIGLVGLALTLSIFEHQRNRFKCLIFPDYSTQDICYQINQSLLAVGSGGFWGKGLGESRQKFLYIPEIQNDFIFSVVGEEMGFLFSVILLGTYVFIFYRAYLIAKNSRDNFAKNLAISIAVWIIVQAFLNIGGVTRILPLTGVPLPFISYGGSALIASMAAIGVLANLSKNA